MGYFHILWPPKPLKEKSFMIIFHEISLFVQNKRRHETSTHLSSSELGFQSEWSRFQIDMEISS